MKKNRQRNYDDRGIDSSCLATINILVFRGLYLYSTLNNKN